MKRIARLALISFGALALVLLLLAATAIYVARGGWLREKVRERIVSEAEKATGGRVEIGAFVFDWSTLTARVDHLTIHGTEPAGEAPLLTVDRVAIGLKVNSLMEGDFDIARVEADAPRAHLIFQPDGRTNIPRPKIPPRRKPGAQTILDLRIGRFVLAKGEIRAEAAGGKSSAAPLMSGESLVSGKGWSARGENLTARVAYNPGGNGASPRYDAEIHLAPVHAVWGGYGPVDLRVDAKGALENDRLLISEAAVKTATSAIDLANVMVRGFAAPVATAQYKAVIWLSEVDKVLRLRDFAHAGNLHLAGTARFTSWKDYQVDGALSGNGIQYGQVGNVGVTARISADPSRVLVDRISVKALDGEITGAAVVTNLRDFRFTGELDNLDARALATLANLPAPPYDGILSGPVHATGKLSEENFHQVVADAELAVSPAMGSLPLRGKIEGHYDGQAGTTRLNPSWLELPGTRVEVSGEVGKRLQVKLQSRNLNELEPALGGRKLPGELHHGTASFDGSVSGPLDNPRIAGRAAIRNAIYEGWPIDSLTADFTATERGVTAANASLASGILRVRTRGAPGFRVGLSGWKVTQTSPVAADLRIDNADLTELLALGGLKNVPVTGTLGATAQIAGTTGDPHATADLTAVRGKIYGEPYDAATVRARYLTGGPQTIAVSLASGAKRLSATASFNRGAAGGIFGGKLTFDVSSNAMPLNQIALVHGREPDLLGTAQIKASGAAELHTDAGKRMTVSLLDLDASASATGMSVAGRSLGDAKLTADTRSGVLTARLDSNAVQAAIHGEGTMRLAGDYPLDAKLTFASLRADALAAALGAAASSLKFSGSAAGQLTVNGPARTPALLTAALDFTQIELRPLPGALSGPLSSNAQAQKIQDLVLRNNGPVRLALEKNVFRVVSARLQAPETDIGVEGSVALTGPSPLNLHLQGKVNLALAQSFNPDLMSAGEFVVNANLRGSLTRPNFSGRAELRNGDFRYADFSNGLTNVQAVVLFNGARANIQTLTAETGGGKIGATGFATLTEGLPAFRLETHAHQVRMRYPEGISSLFDADLTLAGTSRRSEVSGNVTIHRVVINPKSDAANILARMAQPVRTPSAATGLADNMNLDVQVVTAPDVAFQSNVAESISADANLRLRGTVTNPALLGRINITQGEVVFFGNKYTISQGTVSFLNPAKIEPVLNAALETKARGIQITLMITGPLTKLNVSPRSDPPLQFSDIVALLATGRTPTDPTLAARDTGQSQNLQQLGASALIGQALANPGGGGLQRFFGVSRIKVDPQLTGVTGSPEARMTMEQQVTPDLLFTYISDVSSTSTQLVKAEYAFNRQWSAILTREENGYVDMVFAFKKRFR
jgi:translocation and assembly module TamB